MAKSGFRLFVVTLHDNLKREAQVFDKAQPRTLPDTSAAPAAVDFSDVLHQEVNASNETFSFGLPDSAEEAPEAGQVIGTATRLADAVQAGGSVRLWFRAGPINSDGVLADPKGQQGDISLKDLATLFDYRA